MKDLERRIESIASSRLPVLIEGSSGTGKEALAELLHNISGIGAEFTRILCRKIGPVVYPTTSIVSGERDLGQIYAAARGTVFLKNVHMLAPVEQEQLLAALEQVPDSGNGKHQATLVSSATEPLDPIISRGELNPALYHQLSVYRICLPLLRERREDIPELFDHMVRRAANGGGAPPPATSRMLDVLMVYGWPGNLRELQNIARTYVVSAHAEEIIAELSSRSRVTPLALEPERDGRPLKVQVKGASQRLETEIILRTLERHHWNRRRAAQTLQISYRSLLYKMKSCNLGVTRQTISEGK
jgi:two-component system response regulator AtoC